MKETLNLLPPARKPVAFRTGAMIAALASALYIALIVTIWLMNTAEIKRMELTIEELNARKAQIKKQLAVAQRPAPPAAEVAEARVLSAMQNTPPWDTLLAELSVIVPRTVYLDLIESTDSRHMRFKGFSMTHADVAKFIRQLERSPYFQNVEIVYSQKGAQETAFELRAQMKWT